MLKLMPVAVVGYPEDNVALNKLIDLANRKGFVTKTRTIAEVLAS